MLFISIGFRTYKHILTLFAQSNAVQPFWFASLCVHWNSDYPLKTKSSAFRIEFSSSRRRSRGGQESCKLCMSVFDTTSARASTLITISIEFYVLKHILWFYSRRRSCFHFIYCQLPPLGLPLPVAIISLRSSHRKKEINIAFSFY